MHLRSIVAIARKDGIDILLNKSTLSVLLTPILLTIFFLLIGTLIGGHTTHLLVYNPGQSPVVQVVSAAFDSVTITNALSPADVTAAFGPDGTRRESAYDVGLIIPDHFERTLQSGARPQFSLYTNGRSNIDQHENALLQAAIINYARQIAHPQPPLEFSTAMINPPAVSRIGKVLATYYSAVSLMTSFIVGLSLMPGLLIEEKERKTLRMLMVTPASFADVIVGKLLIALIYQLILSGLVLIIQSAFSGQLPLTLLFTVLGAGFSLTLGLLLGSIFSTAGAAGAVGGLLFLAYVAPSILVGPLAALMGTNPITQALKALPTYYMIDGIYNAIQGQAAPGNTLLDLSITAGTTLLLFLLTVWFLRRQAAVAATI